MTLILDSLAARLPQKDVWAYTRERRKVLRRQYFPPPVHSIPQAESESEKPKALPFVSKKWRHTMRFLPLALEAANRYADAAIDGVRPVIKRGEILREVAAKYGVSELDLKSPRRTKLVTIARFEYYWRCRNETTWSLPEIGRFIHKDHTTVLHGVRRYEELRKIKREGRAQKDGSGKRQYDLSLIIGEGAE